MRPPMKSIYGDERYVEVLPWGDVIINVQGPFTKSEDNKMYMLSYHCSRLRIPLLECFNTLQTGLRPSVRHSGISC